MAISDEQLDRFIELYEQKFGIKPNRQVAYDEACKLVRMIRIACFGKIPEGCKIEVPGISKNKSQELIEHNDG